MSDQILTDDEKEALLEGVATGEIEVQSIAGPRYAKVREFEIPERSRIATNTFPRLQSLNQRFANRFGRLAEQLVNADVEIESGTVESCSFGEFCDRNTEFSIAIEFSAAPLPASGLIYVGGDLVRQLVESFYGGGENDPVEHTPDAFTPGETNVAALFCGDILTTLAQVWEPLLDTEHTRLGTHLSTDIIDGFEAGDTVVCADFSIGFLQQRHTFHIVWRTTMLASLLPVFEGQKRERDAAQDAYWEHAIRARITDTHVGISSQIGSSQLTLGAVAELSPGDVIDIGDPQKSTLFVKDVPVLEGTFGVHEGHYALEAKQWLATGKPWANPNSTTDQRN